MPSNLWKFEWSPREIIRKVKDENRLNSLEVGVKL